MIKKLLCMVIAIEGIETVHELLIVVFFIMIENDNL